MRGISQMMIILIKMGGGCLMYLRWGCVILFFREENQLVCNLSLYVFSFFFFFFGFIFFSQGKSTVGFLNPVLYQNPTLLTDMTTGKAHATHSHPHPSQPPKYIPNPPSHSPSHSPFSFPLPPWAKKRA